jgi:hypothetical protein
MFHYTRAQYLMLGPTMFVECMYCKLGLYHYKRGSEVYFKVRREFGRLDVDVFIRSFMNLCRP